MANTSTRILPSATGGGLTRGAQGFVEARELNRQNALRQRRQDLEERAVDIQEQGLAFNRLLQLGPLITPGTSLRQNPFLAEVARTAFQDLDDSTFEAVLDMQLNPETIQTLITEQQKFFFQKLDPENEEDARILEDIGISGLNLGARSRGELDVRNRITGLTGDALLNFQSNPTIQGDIARQVLGLQPTVSIPGLVDEAGEPLVIDSAVAAQLYVALSINRQDNFTARLRLDEAARLDIAKELMTAAEAAGIGLGRPKAAQIVQAYAASVETPEGEIAPIDTLFDRSDPDVQRAIRLFVGAIDLGDTAFDRFLNQSDAGRTIGLLGDLGEFISERMNIPSVDMMAAFQDFLDSGLGEEIGVSVSGGFVRRRRFNFEGRATTGDRGSLNLGDTVRSSNQPSPNGGGDLPDFTNSDVVTAANLLRRGDLSEADLRAIKPGPLVDAAIRLNQENP